MSGSLTLFLCLLFPRLPFYSRSYGIKFLLCRCWVEASLPEARRWIETRVKGVRNERPRAEYKVSFERRLDGSRGQTSTCRHFLPPPSYIPPLRSSASASSSPIEKNAGVLDDPFSARDHPNVILISNQTPCAVLAPYLRFSFFLFFLSVAREGKGWRKNTRWFIQRIPCFCLAPQPNERKTRGHSRKASRMLRWNCRFISSSDTRWNIYIGRNTFLLATRTLTELRIEKNKEWRKPKKAGLIKENCELSCKDNSSWISASRGRSWLWQTSSS